MFDSTQVGSWPRSKKVLMALRDRQKGKLSEEKFYEIADEEVRRCVDFQERAGSDIIVDGELRRDNFYSFITDKVEGTELMSLAQMLDTVEDKAGFEEILEALDVPAAAIKNPTCIAPIKRRESLAGNELAFLKTLTDRPIKITLPGPYLLTRSMWVTGVTDRAYGDKTEMAEDVVKLLRQELIELRDAGAAFVQFDEPVLTEVVHSGETKRRTFM
jgi:5-methyltetrahydropteroyltriglutamate--homocysteine methyltransferase